MGVKISAKDYRKRLLLTEVHIITTSLVTSCRSTSNFAMCSSRWVIVLLNNYICHGDFRLVDKHLSVSVLTWWDVTYICAVLQCKRGKLNNSENRKHNFARSLAMHFQSFSNT